MSADFSYKITTENEQFTFDFSPIMASGETILTATCTVLVKEGTDPNPNDMIIGSPTISGQLVAQRLYGGLDGVIYRIQITITTSLTNTYTIVADLPVLAPLNV